MRRVRRRRPWPTRPTPPRNRSRRAAQDLQAAFDAVRFIYHYTGITGTNGMRMYDNNGNLIQAHGAGIVKAKTSTLAEADRALDENGDGTVYIWCGEDKTDRLVGPRRAHLLLRRPAQLGGQGFGIPDLPR